MPDEDGFDLIGKLRASKRGCNAAIPAVALSAYASEKDRAKSLAAGFQMHVSKPLDASEFIPQLATLTVEQKKK